ncbi:MAG: VWA domain-containing protein, partial [Spirochaetaceae bacterium]|nr:VWA domain-containing protein [Spirochaetaceae bacterium]
MIVGNMTVFFLFLLIPLVILLHIIMRRMESHSVSSTYIWERVKIKRKYTLPPVLLLLLQIMVIVLIILSLADLKVPFTIPLRRENSVLIIDNSASMNVVEKGKSRLDDAKEKAINVIRGSSGETMIITCASPPEIIISYTDKSDDLIKAVKSIENTELSNGIEEVMKIASASVTPEGSIIMVSDGAFNYRPSETDNFKFIRAGNEKKKNIGITDFYLREITGSDSFELYMTVSSFASEKTEFTFQLSAGDEIIKEGDYVIEALETMPFIFPIESQADKEIHGRLITDDLLQTDNSASAYISSHRNKRILLVTPGNFFLEKALESLDGV